MSTALLHEAFYERSPLLKADVIFKNHPTARRYVARINKEGEIVLTVPSNGTRAEALAFANRHREWLLQEREKTRLARESGLQLATLKVGDLVWYRGRQEVLRLEKDWGRPVLCLAKARFFIADEQGDLSRQLQQGLRQEAKEQLPKRVWEIAANLKVKVSKVTIRDQKTRWGSCSTSGTISLNWRLIQVPNEVRDYVIIHELMHTRRFDHSPRFWSLVESACPRYREHMVWLRAHEDALSS